MLAAERTPGPACSFNPKNPARFKSYTPCGRSSTASAAATSRHAAGRLGEAGLDGAQGRDRTTDTAIFSRMLYQLSYLGKP